ncbi:MAG: hypothetical protein GY769_10565, partial [bacterium]|nr:hypothetical protein [bacterium]
GASAVERRIPLPATPTAMLFLDPPDRAFVSFLASSQVSVIDLAESRILADITIGRTGKKLALATAAALSPVFGPIPYTVPNPETSGLLSPDGRTAFLINTQTVDLTAVDTESFEVVEKFPGSLPAVVLDGRALAAFKVKDFVLFDLETRKALPEMELGLGASSISPSGRYAWTGLGSGTAVFDLEARRRVKLFPDVTGQIVFVTTQSRETREKPWEESQRLRSPAP